MFADDSGPISARDPATGSASVWAIDPRDLIGSDRPHVPLSLGSWDCESVLIWVALTLTFGRPRGIGLAAIGVREAEHDPVATQRVP